MTMYISDSYRTSGGGGGGTGGGGGFSGNSYDLGNDFTIHALLQPILNRFIHRIRLDSLHF